MIRLSRLLFLLFLFLYLSVRVFSQSEGDNSAPVPTENELSEEEKKEQEQKELIESLNKKKRETLMYGIDSEVIEVINTIRTEKDSSFNEELAELLNTNDNPEINRAIFEFFSQIESDAGKEKALKLIQDHLDDYDYGTNLILSAISYLGVMKEKEAGDLFYEMLNDNNKSLAGAALRGIGKLENPSRAEEILDFYNVNEGDSEYEDLLASAILVLGDLHYQDAASLFEEVLQDEDAPTVHRQYAAVSLGKLKEDSGFEILKEQYRILEDSNLRSYVLKGLTEYDNSEMDSILISALRDSFWRIRVAASEGLGSRKVEDAVNILIYKVENDPVRQVRYAALDALGELERQDAAEFILGQFENERTPFDIRSKALDIMLEKKLPGSIKSLHAVLDERLEKDKDNELGPFCKTLSSTEWEALQPFYDAMLDNQDFIIRIYGIRGIKINRLSSLKSRVEGLDTENQPINVRREVKAALEVL